MGDSGPMGWFVFLFLVFNVSGCQHNTKLYKEWQTTNDRLYAIEKQLERANIRAQAGR